MASKSVIKEQKSKIVSQFKQSPSDTGSAEVQIALLTTRIKSINEHLKGNQKDFSSKRGLLKMVGQRKALLNYLRTSDASRYLKLIDALQLRK